MYRAKNIYFPHTYKYKIFWKHLMCVCVCVCVCVRKSADVRDIWIVNLQRLCAMGIVLYNSMDVSMFFAKCEIVLYVMSSTQFFRALYILYTEMQFFNFFLYFIFLPKKKKKKKERSSWANRLDIFRVERRDCSMRVSWCERFTLLRVSFKIFIKNKLYPKSEDLI